MCKNVRWIADNGFRIIKMSKYSECFNVFVGPASKLAMCYTSSLLLSMFTSFITVKGVICRITGVFYYCKGSYNLCSITGIFYYRKGSDKSYNGYILLP